MATLRHLHQMMNERRMVRLTDGRVGKIVRVDTVFPDNATIVSVWTASQNPGIAKVALTDIVGDEQAERESA
jgi:hypothetical protein